MRDRIRVMMIGAPYKMHLYCSLAKYLPGNVLLKLEPTILNYPEKTTLSIERSRLWFLPTRRAFRELVRFHPDVVLTDYPTYFIYYSKVYSHLHRQHIPLAAWLLGDIWTEYFACFSTGSLSTKFVNPLRLFAWSTLLNSADGVLSVCKWLEEIVRVRFPEKPTNILYQGVDPEPWLVEDGSTYPYKNPAVGILQDNNILPKVNGLIWFSNVVKQMRDVNFYIAGGGFYTPLVEKAYSGLRNAHLVGRLPYPNGVRRFYRSIDIYILPSELDCCPTTLLEASLCRKPTLASRVGGIPELVKEGETGWTLENGRTDEWIARIESILEDPVMARNIGEKAQQFIMNNFSWEIQATKLASILKELVAENS